MSELHVTEPGSDRKPVLEAHKITKRFGELTANAEVDLPIYSGEIHAVLGENGAGKSTLMKMLYGVYAPDEGQILADGAPIQLTSPADARRHSIGMVFQNYRLAPALTVWENIALTLPDLPVRLGPQALQRRITEVAAQYDLDVEPTAFVWQLDVGQRQRVEILKVLLSGARVLLLDEPTSVLAVTEVDGFLAILRRLRDEGYGILLVTHKIREVLACADRTTIMRGGRVVFSTAQVAGLDEAQLITHMVGEWTAPISSARHLDELPEPILQVVDLEIHDDRERAILSHVNFTLAPGEILGVAGISGNGQRELAEALLGLRVLKHGQILIDRTPLAHDSPIAVLQAGISSIPENAVEEAIVPGLTVLEHMALGGIETKRKGLRIDWQAALASFQALPEVAALRVAAPDRRADGLSGGNVQRLVVSRALARTPRILIAAYPSRGLDISTTRAVHQALFAHRDRGMAILLFSEDLNELYAVADRLMVVSHERVSAPIDPRHTDIYQVAAQMVTRSH
jgi:simple sugar transport system ATP-binding protein